MCPSPRYQLSLFVHTLTYIMTDELSIFVHTLTYIMTDDHDLRASKYAKKNNCNVNKIINMSV